MIVPPEYFRNYSWIGIDPGLATCGISVFRVFDNRLQSIEAFTLINNKIRFESEYQEEFQSERNAKMHRLCLAFRSVLYSVNPILICCESPFYNPKMPSAFGSLTETVTALRMETNQYNINIPFICYSPQQVKQTFKRSGQTGKLVMREALAQDNNLRSKLITPVETLDEHAVDAIAVGQTYAIALGF